MSIADLSSGAGKLTVDQQFKRRVANDETSNVYKCTNITHEHLYIEKVENADSVVNKRVFSVRVHLSSEPTAPCKTWDNSLNGLGGFLTFVCTNFTVRELPLLSSAKFRIF